MIRLFVFAALLLAGCSRGPYWEYTNSPGLVAGVLETADIYTVCRAAALGCYDRTTGIVWLVQGLDPTKRQCVISHEYHHAAGFTHPGFNEPGLGVDCGDGTIV